MRTYQNINPSKDQHTIALLKALIEPNTSVADYRRSFYLLGNELGNLLNKITNHQYGNTVLSCANEDADWLAQGVLDKLSSNTISLAVFWNDRIKINQQLNIEYSPIIRSYIEPVEDCQTLIIVKSIISTSCVVKTQITHLVNKISPKVIYILAPVMYKDAAKSLSQEFPTDIVEKFHFITFAIDSERENNTIIPGIGGMVYPKLGLGDYKDKNKYIPQLVKERMKF